jgi:hypothetical protein
MGRVVDAGVGRITVIFRDYQLKNMRFYKREEKITRVKLPLTTYSR